MRSLLLIFCITILGSITFVYGEQTPSPSGASAHNMKFDPRLAPEYVELLKQQAVDRKKFYSDRAKAGDELHEKHAKERVALVEGNRSARHRFEDEKHVRNERAAFFKSQRSAMSALEARQKAEFLDLDADLEKKLSEFHEHQRKDREELTEHLLKKHQ